MTNTTGTPGPPPASMEGRAAWLAAAGGLNAAVAAGRLDEPLALPLAEALVLGLMRQGVTKYLAIFGHGSTALGEVLRVYQARGLVRCWHFRNEVAMAHAATALRWVYGEPSAVVTSIGPGRCRRWPGRWRRPPTASASITSTATRPPTAKATTCSRCRSRRRGSSGR